MDTLHLARAPCPSHITMHRAGSSWAQTDGTTGFSVDIAVTALPMNRQILKKKLQSVQVNFGPVAPASRHANATDTKKSDLCWTRTPAVTQESACSDHFDSSTFTWSEKLSYQYQGS